MGTDSPPVMPETRCVSKNVKSQQKGDTFSSFLKASQPGVESDDEARPSAGHRVAIEDPEMGAGRAAPGRTDVPAFRHLANRVLPVEATV
jgi:hypothetical protein